MKKQIFFFLAVVGVSLNAEQCTSNKTLFMNIDNDGKTLIEFNIPVAPNFDTTRNDGLIIEEIDPEHKSYMISFKKAKRFKVLPSDKDKQIFDGVEFAKKPAEVYFFTENQDKCIVSFNPVEKTRDLQYIKKIEFGMKKELEKEKIFEFEKKDFDNERDRLLSLNLSVFKPELIENDEGLSLYTSKELNQVVVDTKEFQIVLNTRKEGAKFNQDIYTIISKINGLDLSSLIEKFSGLPPYEKKARLTSIIQGTILDRGEKSTIVIAREVGNNENR